MNCDIGILYGQLSSKHQFRDICQSSGRKLIPHFTHFLTYLGKVPHTELLKMIVGVLITCHTQYNTPSFCYIPYRCSICAPFVILQTSTR